MSAAKAYKFTSDVGKFNASALLAAKEAGKDVEADETLKAIAEKSYAKFHVKGGLFENNATSVRALRRLRRDLQRLKDSKWSMPAAVADEKVEQTGKPKAASTDTGSVQKRTSKSAGV